LPKFEEEILHVRDAASFVEESLDGFIHISAKIMDAWKAG